MRIAWFTPFKKASAIGRFSRNVTNQLAKHAQVDLWLADSENLHETTLRVIPYTKIPNADYWLREYDAVVYNLGDCLDYHREIYLMSQRVPGIVVLHDFVMHHFFAGYFILSQNWAGYVETMRRWYQIADLPADVPGGIGGPGRVWETDDVVRYPLFEEAIRGCVAVIAHAKFLQERVAKVTSAPVRKINLAYEAEHAVTTLAYADLDIPAGRTLAITVGNVNENKRVHVVLEALAKSPALRKKLMYVVIGDCGSQFGQQVQELSRQHDLQNVVRFIGFAESDLLHAYLNHADLCINLRLPAMEGASASCIEQMLYGKPVIVTDNGFYSELPDDCVRKVRPMHEIDDLTRHLNGLIADGKTARALGLRARRYAEESFRSDEYARSVLDLARELKDLSAAFGLADTIGSELRAIGVTPGMAIVDTVAREGALLLDGRYDPPVLRLPEGTNPPGV